MSEVLRTLGRILGYASGLMPIFDAIAEAIDGGDSVDDIIARIRKTKPIPSAEDDPELADVRRDIRGEG